MNKIGLKFGKLLVTDKTVRKGKRNELYYLCECDCGKTKFIANKHLKNGGTISCGCMRGKPSHRMSNTRLHNIWLTMRARCNNTNDKYYGAKGIKVCDEWNEFVNFMNWSLNNGYKDNLEIERININKGYEPSNCKWITRKEQMQNTTRNKYYEAFGDKGTIRFFCDKYKISYNALRTRLYTKTMEEAIKMGKEKPSYKIEKYEYKNFIGTRKQICDKLGLNYHTIKSRMNIHNKTLKEAIEMSLKD